jgi:uncharacterized membrane protein
LPGSAERVFKLVESEQLHRHEMQKAELNAQIADQSQIRQLEKRGQLFGFLIGIVVMGVVGTAALNDKEVTASILGIGGLTGLVSVFVLGRQKQEQEEKMDP